MKSITQNRQVGPDYAKMIGIILVVWGHTIRGLISAGILPADSVFWINVDRAIYLFHMPLFFFLSGLFIQQTLVKTDLTDFFKRNVLIFLLPLIFWSYTQAGIQYMASSEVNIQRSFEYVLLAPFPPKQQFWFLWSLFLIACFSAVLLKINNGKTLLGLLAVIVMVVLSIGQQANTPWITYKMEGMTFGEAFFFLPYFVMGVMLSTPAVIQQKSTFFWHLVMFFAAIGLYLLLYRESNAFYYLFSCVSVYLCYQSIAYIGASIESRVSNTNGNSWLSNLHRALIFIGMNSFIIYLAHIIPEAGIRVLLVKLGIVNPAIHILAGNTAGLLMPLLLVPINMLLIRYWSSAKYVIPVRRLKYD